MLGTADCFFFFLKMFGDDFGPVNDFVGSPTPINSFISRLTFCISFC